MRDAAGASHIMDQAEVRTAPYMYPADFSMEVRIVNDRINSYRRIADTVGFTRAEKYHFADMCTDCFDGRTVNNLITVFERILNGLGRPSMIPFDLATEVEFDSIPSYLFGENKSAPIRDSIRNQIVNISY
ncbi:MAG: hypothetical protein ABIH89_06945 [Elusimicrobiota bacterium]